MNGKHASRKQPKRESTPDPRNDEESMSSLGDQSKQKYEAKIDDLSHQVGLGAYEQKKGK